MAKATEYAIVGRYMDGKEVTGYHLQNAESGKNQRFSREQVAFMVGRKQITNCSGQIYQDKLILRGVGISLDDLPVQQESTGELSRTDNIGKVRKGTSAEDAMNQYIIVASIVNGRDTLGYVIQNAGGATAQINRDKLLALAKESKIGNARVQMYNGKYLLRGVGCNLNELPVIGVPQDGNEANTSGKSQSGENGTTSSKPQASTQRSKGVFGDTEKWFNYK